MKLRFGTLNVNTLRGRVCEVVEKRYPAEELRSAVCKTRYHGGHCRVIKGKDTRYKLFWSGNNKGTLGVGVMVAESG